ncbi:YncE family protein [Akkermansia glycaniphila]|uniref:Lactonase 7-bladed beta-propeller n=1 Tax=Akkermansia glycaniphila TaxID=1679444 RepID=A0A1C7PDS6_9BACT|nr:beta-propeller fold lactonase family protein [Akkermansia glycaniphila]OCA03559.1 hypothetical protein AC781_03835 [Akkermansia glycaniphila]SEH74487.1 lactonase 7-bladed beta-propeller [Akkermansia glycaniphila]
MNKILFLIVFVLTVFCDVKASEQYALDRVYTGNQVSNTVSVIAPATNVLLGEIILGKPYPNVLSPLYKGASLVHGLRYDEGRKILAVVSIGSNSVTFISTLDNKVLKTVYVGRAPHEPTFTPDGKEIWVTVRGEAYLSVINMDTLTETTRVPVADGPGMIAFSQDGKYAYVCSSFTPEVDVVDKTTYRVIKKIPVISPFSPNIYTSPDGKLVALTHKDVGKVTVIDTSRNEVIKVFSTGAITNHVSFAQTGERLLLAVTVGGENCVKFFDVADDYKQIATIPVDVLPHGLWPSPDGRRLYVGLEYSDMVQVINLENMTVSASIKIGQSPQALVYAQNAVNSPRDSNNLSNPRDPLTAQVIVLKPINAEDAAFGQLSVRQIGRTKLIEQLFLKLKPDTSYTLAFSKSLSKLQADYEINAFQTESNGKYAAQSDALLQNAGGVDYECVVLRDDTTGQIVMVGESVQ